MDNDNQDVIILNVYTFITENSSNLKGDIVEPWCSCGKHRFEFELQYVVF